MLLESLLFIRFHFVLRERKPCFKVPFILLVQLEARTWIVNERKITLRVEPSQVLSWKFPSLYIVYSQAGQITVGSPLPRYERVHPAQG